VRLSTRSRYGVRFMVDLALRGGENAVYLKDIAREEGLSEKYLSLIAIPLKSAGLIVAQRGAKGGYRLARPASRITLKEIVEVLEKGVCIVECVGDPSTCSRSGHCPSRDLWAEITDRIASTLASVTLEDLARKGREKAYAACMYVI